MYPVHLVQLIRSREYGIKGRNLEHDTPSTPDIHLVVVVAISHQALGRTVPSSRDVLGVWMLRVHALTRTQVSQLQVVVLQ